MALANGAAPAEVALAWRIAREGATRLELSLQELKSLTKASD